MNKIIRDGDITFVVGSGIGWGFNLKHISKMTAEDCEDAYGADKGYVYVNVWTGSSHPTTMKLTYDEARQAFQDSPWVKILPTRKS